MTVPNYCCTKGCVNRAEPGLAFCAVCVMTANPKDPAYPTQVMKNNLLIDVAIGGASPKLEKSGGDVSYYIVDVPEPKRLAPYKMEVEDIIEALEMSFAEGTVLKALIRSCNLRKHGIGKEGEDIDGVYDGDKIAYYGERVKVQRRRKAKK